MSSNVSQPPAPLIPALQLYRRGDVPGARQSVAAALQTHGDEPALLEFAGLLAAQTGDHSEAAAYFRRHTDVAPEDLGARVNLVTALIGARRLDEALAACADRGEPALLRLAGYIHQQEGRLAEAAAAYEAELVVWPGDFESWNNLGNVRVAQGDLEAAIAAFQRALVEEPGIPEMYLNLSEVLVTAERPEARVRVMRQAAQVAPGNAAVQAELGLALSAVRDFAEAEAAYREAIRLNPNQVSAYLDLALLLENLNRTDELDRLAAEAEVRAGASPEIAFVKAWALRRQGRIDEALPLAEATPESIHPVRRAQLLAELYDRTGDTDRAFAAFEDMNRAAAAARPAPQGPSYRAQVEARVTRLTPQWVADWTRHPPEAEPRAPTFIVGFPRSGTTLLDTLLMNVPDFHVLEELPVLRAAEIASRDESKLARLDRDEVRRLRGSYFQALEALAPPQPGQRVIDKSPLHMARMPLVHRLFPDAKVILVERHPCDAVLSCFMANFNLNLAMRSFVDLEEAARTYDAVFEAWTRAATLLPIEVHRVRYEHMVEDLEGEMRPLLAFLGREWDPSVLDNQASAARRDHIRTASYSQVGEPLYKRAAGRWERYRRQMEPVLPILAPWAERMGYDL